MTKPGRERPQLLDVGGVLAAWMLFVAFENVVVGFGYRDEFTAAWEMGHARTYLSPLLIGGLLPLAFACVFVGFLVATRNARAVGVLGALFAGAVAYGVSTGRHLAGWAVRAPFIGVVAAIGGLGAYVLARRALGQRRRTIAAAGAALACAAWLADAFVLPRLYPAFHFALFVLALGAWSTTWLLVRDPRARSALGTLGLVVTVLALATTERLASGVRRDDNLRRVLLERAPVLGRAVVLASRIVPPPPLEDDAASGGAAAAAVGPAVATHALDWRDRDVILVTIDALRADHVSSYGYARKTTPNIDALAARGARFTHAYCPTPHTSYSVTSLMTGKYIKPLLAMGVGEDSETWPTYMRRYGFRTAAFYPPAVFFIDEHRFQTFSEAGLGFEYRKVEFAKPALRREQIERYLASAPKDKPLFLWVHLFEPHEPYEMHAEHPFEGDPRVDAYDSEVAAADALVGSVVELVERRRPGAVFVVSADHGEELGDHGGRYHGTTVYEEQVRVPLVVVGPGVAPRVVTTPVQTIDLLPTTLSALDIPMPARLRGRDLGGLLAGRPPADEGLAFAETDDWTLVARGADRLVCARKIASCTLFDVAKDPGQKHAVVDRPERVQELRRLLAAIERENGKLEKSALPEALRRGMQGDRDAAQDVAPLLDDARVDIRRAAARCAFRLKAPEMKPALARALARDEDAQVGEWSALALYRLGDDGDDGDAATRAANALRSADAAARTAAALALAERGDGRGEGELVSRWNAGFGPGARDPGELDEAREILSAFAKLRARTASPSLVRSLDDVRLRPFVVDALGEIGDPRAKEPLLATFAEERYVHFRPKEARALVRLGAREELRAPLARFAGVPEPMVEALAIARAAGLLRPARGGVAWDEPRPELDQTLTLEGEGPARLLLATRGAGAPVLTVDDAPVAVAPHGDVWIAELPGAPAPRGAVRVRVQPPGGGGGGVSAVWAVRRAAEVPPPPPREWDAGVPETAFDAPSEAGLQSAP